jgi:hypothetical protein
VAVARVGAQAHVAGHQQVGEQRAQLAHRQHNGRVCRVCRAAHGVLNEAR